LLAQWCYFCILRHLQGHILDLHILDLLYRLLRGKHRRFGAQNLAHYWGIIIIILIIKNGEIGKIAVTSYSNVDPRGPNFSPGGSMLWSQFSAIFANFMITSYFRQIFRRKYF
jgi:hypothetical protein